MIVVTVIFDERPDSYLCESGGDGGYPGFLSEWTVGSGVVLKWFRVDYWYGIQ